MSKATIAVTGATGQLGGRVAKKLDAQQIPSRLIVRDLSRAPDLQHAEAVAASYIERDSMLEALKGIETVFFVSGFESEDRLVHHKAAVEAFVESGVKRVVYTSFLGAASDATFTFARQHFVTEEYLRTAGLDYVALRNSLYLDVLPYFAVEGEIRCPAGHGRFAPVAREDIADVAVHALLDKEIKSGSYNVTGAELLSMQDVAALLSSIQGTTVKFVNEGVEEAYASRAHYDASDYEKEGWVTSYLAIARGEMNVVSDVVKKFTGHDPITPAAFLQALQNQKA